MGFFKEAVKLGIALFGNPMKSKYADEFRAENEKIKEVNRQREEAKRKQYLEDKERFMKLDKIALAFIKSEVRKRILPLDPNTLTRKGNITQEAFKVLNVDDGLFYRDNYNRFCDRNKIFYSGI